jgi:hypothetical protein
MGKKPLYCIQFKSSPTTCHGGVILDLGTRWGEWSGSLPVRALGPTVPIVQEAGWAPEPVWTQRLEERSFASAGNRTSIARSSRPYADTILPELPASHLSSYAYHTCCITSACFRLYT